MPKTFEVFYIVRHYSYERADKIVAGPYYNHMEACEAREKLEEDSPHRERVFMIMSHTLELS